MANTKKKATPIPAISASDAWSRCRCCEFIGRGKTVGKCTHTRIKGVYLPVQQIVNCPEGYEIPVKASL